MTLLDRQRGPKGRGASRYPKPVAHRLLWNARSALDCGSLLPLSQGQLAGRPVACTLPEDISASKLAKSKRQQAAALQSLGDAQVAASQ